MAATEQGKFVASVRENKWSVNLSWRNLEGAAVDLDLVCVATDDKGHYVDSAFFHKNSKPVDFSGSTSPAITHSGDARLLVGEGTGYEEIWIDSLRLIPGTSRHLAHLYFMVTSYSAGAAFEAAAGIEAADKARGLRPNAVIRVCQGEGAAKVDLLTYEFDQSILAKGWFFFGAAQVAGIWRVYELMREADFINFITVRRDFSYGLLDTLAFSALGLERATCTSDKIKAVKAGETGGAVILQGTKLPPAEQGVPADRIIGGNYLFVKVQFAVDVIAADRGNTSDPYVKIIHKDVFNEVLAGDFKTTVKPKTLNPVWYGEDTYIFTIYANAQDTLDFEVWDKDMIGTDDFLGMFVNFPVQSTTIFGPHFLPLQQGTQSVKAKKAVTGMLSVAFAWGPQELAGESVKVSELFATKTNVEFNSLHVAAAKKAASAKPPATK